MTNPIDKAGIRCLLGMTNFLAHFPPSQHSYETCLHFSFEVQSKQITIKEILSTAPVLSNFDSTVTSNVYR